MIPISISLIYSVIYIALFSLFTLITLKINPRIWLHDYPKEIQDDLEPKSALEKRDSVRLSLFFILLFVGTPLIMTFLNPIRMSGSIPYLPYFFHFMIILQLANLNDLLILDWLIFCRITPGFLVISGSEGHKGYKNYLFHFVGFLKGCIISTVISAIFALICFLWDKI